MCIQEDEGEEQDYSVLMSLENPGAHTTHTLHSWSDTINLKSIFFSRPPVAWNFRRRHIQEHENGKVYIYNIIIIMMGGINGGPAASPIYTT